VALTECDDLHGAASGRLGSSKSATMRASSGRDRAGVGVFLISRRSSVGAQRMSALRQLRS